MAAKAKKRKKVAWSVLHVVEHKGRKVFMHGAQVLRYVDASQLDDNNRVRVLRAGKLLDDGHVYSMGGHDGGYYFTGLEKIIPAHERCCESINDDFDRLRPRYFQVGDTVRLEVHASALRNGHAMATRA